MSIDFKKIKTGVIGEIVEILYPMVECNKESLLIQLLACYGNCIGRSAHFYAAQDRHHSNLFVAIVGKSSVARKGMALNLVKSLFEEVDIEWYKDRIKKGLASGEGLITKLSDVSEDQADILFKSPNIFARDKRILCLESEFSGILKITQRDGNILSQILRDAWDCVPLENLTKHSPARVTDPMVSIIGHITDTELIKYLSSTEVQNGLGPRFLFIRAMRDKKIAHPKPIDADVKKHLTKILSMAVERGKNANAIEFDENAYDYWEEFYNSLSKDDCTMVGALTVRQEAQVRRLAMIIAIFNFKDRIDVESLMFAEKIFDYSIESLREIYGYSFGDTFTDRIYDLLKASPDGLSKSQLHDKLGRNYQKGNLDRSLSILKSQGLVESKKVSTEGRPSEVWFVVKAV